MKDYALLLFSRLRRKIGILFFTIFVVLSATLMSCWSQTLTLHIAETTEHYAMQDIVITIDPGHGGFDPGKVGVSGVLEKDINLSIASYLKNILEEQGYTVYLTRETDISLHDAGASHKKSSDMNNRIAFVAEQKTDLLISIHQNSFSQASVHGAQVFYYAGSSEGELLAGMIQDNIRLLADPENARDIKGNSEYKILTASPCTAVIVECGFLSNNTECEKLSSSEYQQLIAQSIANGIIAFLSS